MTGFDAFTVEVSRVSLPYASSTIGLQPITFFRSANLPVPNDNLDE